MALAMYGDHPDVHHWTQHWEEQSASDLLASVQGSFLEMFIYQHIPCEGRVLEAGCGLGQWVMYLRRQDRPIVGVDFSIDALRWANQQDGSLPLLAGDVLALPFQDGTFSLALSFGVVEHFESGPQAALQEVHRVLGHGGVLLCTTPYFNPIRHFKKSLFSPWYQNPSAGREFYQFAFDMDEIRNWIQSAGFTIHKVIPWDASKGLADEVPLLRTLRQYLRKVGGGKSQSPPLSEAAAFPKRGGGWLGNVRDAARFVVNSAVLRRLAGHMVLVVAQKP